MPITALSEAQQLEEKTILGVREEEGCEHQALHCHKLDQNVVRRPAQCSTSKHAPLGSTSITAQAQAQPW